MNKTSVFPNATVGDHWIVDLGRPQLLQHCWRIVTARGLNSFQVIENSGIGARGYCFGVMP
jgi:hypothetical protein